MENEDYQRIDTIFATPIEVTGVGSDIYISGEILSPENYIREFQQIRTATKDDIITLRLNTTGGRIDTAIQFIRAMQDSEATIIASMEGSCLSAGSMIFLKADYFEVSDYSIMLCHNYSGGTRGKGHEIYAQATFEQPWAHRMLNKIYKGFLSKKEIKSVVSGTDLWLTSDEVLIRCQALLEYRESLQENQQN